MQLNDQFNLSTLFLEFHYTIQVYENNHLSHVSKVKKED